eukprot:5502325-Heterocapsa_arctica.AAC.1
MTIHSESGGSYDFWIECLTTFIQENNALMSVDMDGVRRFPANVPCVIFDNLHVLYNNNSNQFIGMPLNEWANVRAMFVLMDRFRSRFYVCSASASRQDLKSGFDVASARARKFSSAMNIPCWSGA